MLIQEPYTKGQFEKELLTLPPREAESRREFWIVCEILQSFEDIGREPPAETITIVNDTLAKPPEEQAERWRYLRQLLLEELAEQQRQRQRWPTEWQRARKYSNLK